LKTYFQLNKHKIYYAIKVYLAGFLLLALVSIVVILYFFYLSPQWVILIALVSALVLTTYLVLQSYTTGKYIFERRRQVFRIPALHEFFNANGFALIETLKESKWDFTEESMIGKIMDFMITVDIDENEPSYLLFKFNIVKPMFEKESFKEFLLNLNEFKSVLFNDAVWMRKDITRLGSAVELLVWIETFITMLKSSGIQPRW